MIKVYLNTLEETTKALQDGKVVYVNNDGNQFKLINGIVCRFNRGGKLEINPSIPVEHSYIYTYEPEQLKLEVGKFYKTRDGKKAFICAFVDDDQYPFSVAREGDVDTYPVTNTGKLYLDEGQSDSDIIDYWRD